MKFNYRIKNCHVSVRTIGLLYMHKVRQGKLTSFLFLFLIATIPLCYGSTLDKINRRSKTDSSQGWEILFDGSNTAKWRGINSDTFPAGWVIEQGNLVLDKAGSGDIITREKYDDFELVFDFKLTLSANSGIKYFVDELENKNDKTVLINGPEYQIIDDYNHPAVKDGQHPEGSTSSLYLIYAPKHKKLFPAGQWNEGRIVAKGNHVEHWLNGRKVVSYTRGSRDFKRKVSGTKFKDYANYGELRRGHILLTDHSDKTYFRNIKVKRL